MPASPTVFPAALPPDVSQARPTRSPSASSGGAPAGTGAADSAELFLLLAEDHEGFAQDLNDVVVRRLFAAGLGLQGALGLIGDQRAADMIERALGELDLAIANLRDTIFDRWVT